MSLFPIPDPLSAQVADSYLIFKPQLEGHFRLREASPVAPSSRRSWPPPGPFVPVSCGPMTISVPLGAFGVWGPCLYRPSSPEGNRAGRERVGGGFAARVPSAFALVPLILFFMQMTCTAFFLSFR